MSHNTTTVSDVQFQMGKWKSGSCRTAVPPLRLLPTRDFACDVVHNTKGAIHEWIFCCDVMQIVDPEQNALIANQISFYFEHQKKGIGKNYDVPDLIKHNTLDLGQKR